MTVNLRNKFLRYFSRIQAKIRTPVYQYFIGLQISIFLPHYPVARVFLVTKHVRISEDFRNVASLLQTKLQKIIVQERFQVK